MSEKEGWIKLYRKVLDNPIMGNLDLFGFLCYLLLRVNHKKASVYIKNTKYELLPGQGIISQKDLSQRFKVSISTINKRLACLKTETIIETKADNKCTVITFVNRESHQSEGNQNRNQNESKPKPERNQSETNKNDKNVNNEKNNKKERENLKKENDDLTSSKKAEFIARIRDAQNRGKVYIAEREKLTGQKIVADDAFRAKLGNLIKQVGIDEFKITLEKYLKVSEFAKKNTKYVFEAYKTIDIYTLEKFIDKIDLFAKDPEDIVRQIQDQRQGGELLNRWIKQNRPPQTQEVKQEVKEIELTEEQKKENTEKFNFMKICIFSEGIQNAEAIQMRDEAKKQQISPYELLNQHREKIKTE